MPESTYSKSNRWLTVILITPEEFGADREQVIMELDEKNIEARPIWPPARLRPVGDYAPEGRAYASERSRCICRQSSTAVQACPPEGRRGSGIKSRTKQKEV